MAWRTTRRTRRKNLISTQAATMRSTSPTQWKSSAHHAMTTPTVPSSPPASASNTSSRLAQSLRSLFRAVAQHGSASAPLIASTRATSARCARRASSAAAVHQRARTSTHRDMACVLPAAACLSSSCNSCRYLIASMTDGVQRPAGRARGPYATFRAASRRCAARRSKPLLSPTHANSPACGRRTGYGFSAPFFCENPQAGDANSESSENGFRGKRTTNVQHRIIRKIYKSNYSNIIRYYSTGIIVKNMVLLLNYRARGAPSLGPTPRDGPLPHSPGVPRPGPPPATCLGPKAVPHASIFPIQPVLLKLPAP